MFLLGVCVVMSCVFCIVLLLPDCVCCLLSVLLLFVYSCMCLLLVSGLPLLDVYCLKLCFWRAVLPLVSACSCLFLCSASSCFFLLEFALPSACCIALCGIVLVSFFTYRLLLVCDASSCLWSRHLVCDAWSCCFVDCVCHFLCMLLGGGFS